VRHSTFTVLYDACVLYPAPLRDLLVWLALSGRFRARWTARIHEEWKRNLLKNRPNLSRSQLDRTSALMDTAVPDAVVSGYENLMACLALPDPNDHHVLAAAIRCSASVIVTFNLGDFPSRVLDPLGMEAQHPDEFVENLLDLDAAAVVGAVQNHRRTLRNPVLSAEAYLETLVRQGLRGTAKELESYRPTL